MPISLVTGLPGNAKTLMALEMLIDRAASEKRPVFYSGLKEFQIDDKRLKGTSWTEVDPTRWMDCPAGSLIFIDECQKTFRNRSLGSHPPLHVTELEEHRHRGIDFVMVTQHPGLIDPAIRKLTQHHYHMVRIFGMEASTIHKWDSVRDNCDKPGMRKDSQKRKWVFAKHLYGLYLSADQHTIKRSIPMRVKLLFAVPLVLAAAAYAVYGLTVGKAQKTDPAALELTSQNRPGGQPASLAPAQIAKFDPVQDARNYVAMNTPRIEGLPHTAPKYDELTKPVRVPIPAMCIQSGTLAQPTCKCFTQQGTPMDTSLQLCIGFARNGFFEEFDADKDRSDSARTRQSVAVMDRVPDRSYTPPSGSPRVLAMADTSPVSRLSGPPPMPRDRSSDRHERSAETGYQ